MCGSKKKTKRAWVDLGFFRQGEDLLVYTFVERGRIALEIWVFARVAVHIPSYLKKILPKRLPKLKATRSALLVGG